MWVRSQNKKILTNRDHFVVELVIARPVIFASQLEEEHNAHAGQYCIGCGGEKLGWYSTEEKALKVLDELQFWCVNQSTVCFQMPQDSEVE